MKCAKLEIYRDRRGEWRWRLRASNGRILADSGEGYRRLASARHAAERVRSILASDALVTEVLR